MQVRDVMTRNVVTIEPDASLEAAEELMRRGGFRHLPVVAAGQLAGVVTERDVLPPPGLAQTTVAAHRGRPVRSVMSAGVISVAPEDPLEEAARLLLENKINCLPVVSGSALQGIITGSDIFRSFMQITGLIEPATRIEVRTERLADGLEAIGRVANALKIGISSLVTERPPDGGTPIICVRFASMQGARIARALRDAGLDVLNPDPAGGL